MQSDTANDALNFESFLAWLHHNRKPVAIGGTIIVVGLIAISLYSWRKTQKEIQANVALFALPSLVGSAENTSPVKAEDFAKVAQDYSGTKAGTRAEILAAGVLFTDGKYVEAEKQFTKFLNDNPGSPLEAEAALGVAAALEAQGKTQDAIAKYQQVIAKYPASNVIAPAKLTLARLLESQNKSDEALKQYDDLMRATNPYDPWAAEARERRELLLQKFPNLNNKSDAAPPAAVESTSNAAIPATTNSPAPK